MKKTTKFLSLLLGLALVLSTLSATVCATEVETVILYTNDVHCAIDDYAVLAAYRAELIAQGKNVVTVDAGDAIQGEVIGSTTEGEAVVDIMNAVGYDYAVPGNHEFDYGMDRFLELAQSKAEYDYISSNFYYLPTVSPVLTPYVVEDFCDYQVAFVGITTPDTITSSTPEFFKDENGNFLYGFPAYPGGITNQDLYDNIQESVDNAIDDGADFVVAVGHIGILGSNDGWKTTDIIANTDGIDYFIDAHAHEIIQSTVYKNEANEDVIVTSTGSKFQNFGMMTITEGGTEFKLINPDDVNIEMMSADAKSAYDAVKEKIDGYNEEIAYLYDEIGTSEAKLIIYDSDGSRAVRKRETNAGDFVADAYRAVTGADVAIANGGGIRAEVEIGGVSRKNLMDVNAFNNGMCVLEVTGQQIIDILEHGARKCPEVLGSFFQVSGMTFEIHTYRETPVITDQLDNFIEIDSNKERRVQNVCVDGEPIDLNKKYTLAGSTYVLLQGGDGLTMLDDARVIQQEGLPCDSEMLIEYFTEHLNGKITAEKYGDPDGEGRIKIVDSHNHSFSDSDKCTCGAQKADYSGYDEAYERFQKIMDDNNLNAAAIEYAREKHTEMINEHLGGMWLKNNYSEDEQHILDGLEKDMNDMCDALEDGIANGTFIKPDYTDIEEKIAEFENTHPGEEYEEIIAEMKADLEDIKASNPESNAEIADDIAAIEEKIDNAENGCHINSRFEIIEFVLRIISFLLDLLF